MSLCICLGLEVNERSGAEGENFWGLFFFFLNSSGGVLGEDYMFWPCTKSDLECSQLSLAPNL